MVLRWFVKGLSWGPKTRCTLAHPRGQLLRVGEELGGCSDARVECCAGCVTLNKVCHPFGLHFLVCAGAFLPGL